jgi:hypothetical protein
MTQTKWWHFVFTCRSIAEKGPLSLDNFYNPPALVQRLKSLKTVLEPCTSIEKECSRTMKEKNLKKGELIAQHSGPLSILKWNDKKDNRD